MGEGWDNDAFRKAAEEYRNRRDVRGGDNVYPIRSEVGVDDYDRAPDEAYGLEVDARGTEEPTRTSAFYSAASLKGKPIPPREWLVPDMIPARTVTLFYGDGGTGKSLLALQLAVAVAAGTPWAGRAVKQGAALMISAEDEEDELHRRLHDILRAEGRDYDDVAALTLRSVAGEDALLAVDGALALTATSLFEELEERAQIDAPDLIVIDTLADVYPANENDRAKVRQFVGMLRGLALRRNCAVVVLAHPSLSGLNSGSGTSGSTAWNNSVRSRLYLSRIVSNGIEDDTRKRTLSVMKSNYGDTGMEIPLTWQDGSFRTDPMETGLDRMARGAKAERVFLKLLRQMMEENRKVNPSGGQTYAPKVFAAHPHSEGVSQAGFRAAMDTLMAQKVVVQAEYGPPSKRREYLIIKGDA